jgi:hypothetical protein
MRSLLALLSIVVTLSATHIRSSTSSLLPRRSKKKDHRREESKNKERRCEAGGEDLMAFDTPRRMTLVWLAITQRMDWLLLAQTSQRSLRLRRENSLAQHA